MEELGTGNYSGNIKIISREAGLIATVTQYVRDDFNGNEHYHLNPHISFTIDGGFVEKKKESVELMPGNITYYYSGEKHQVTRIAQSGIRVNLEIEQSFMDNHSVSENDMQRAFTGSPDAKFLFVKISRELLQNDQFTVPSIQMLFLHHIRKPKNASGPNQAPGWIPVVKGYLEEHWDEGLDLLKIAAAAGVHPVTVSRYFPKYFGCSLGEYLRKLKIEKALCLVKMNNSSLTRTAYESGFFDQSHFIRSFKKFNGLLPSAYKKLGR